MQGEYDTAVFAVLLAVAIAGVEDIVNLLRVQGDKTETVGDEFVCQYGGVGFDFDKVDSHGGYFGKDDSAERIGKGQINI